MKLQKVEATQERKVLIAMVMDKIVLGAISAKWEERGLFRTRFGNLIGGWCIRYFLKYQDAPKRSLVEVFDRWKRKNRDEDLVEQVETLLTSLSDEYERDESEYNSQHMIDLAGEYFNQVRLSDVATGVSSDLQVGLTEQASNRVTNFRKVQLGLRTAKNILVEEEVPPAFEMKMMEDIVSYPGDLGVFLKGQLEREAFVAFIGREKSGKSFWLIDLAWRAVLQKRKVAFFEVGDMSELQVKRRFYIRAARHPMRSRDGRWPFTVKWPNRIDPPPNDEWGKTANVSYEHRVFAGPLTKEVAVKALKKTKRKRLAGEDYLFKMACYPTVSISVQGIKAELESWDRMGFTPDVVVIDYADILAHAPGLETRDAVNQTWQELRGLSLERHCLVVTATQSNAAAYKQRLLTQSNFSEDKRKHGAVNGMIGINVTPEEREAGVYRLNWVDLREGEYSDRQVIHVAGSLALASPCVISSW